MKYNHAVICCCSDYKLIEPETISKVLSAADHASLKAKIFSDLCLLAVEQPEILKRTITNSTLVTACSVRAVKALLCRADINSAPDVINLRKPEYKDIASLLDVDLSVFQSGKFDLPEYENSWKAWYPLLDYEKCTSCGKCIDYCLFGVYCRKDKKVQVENPANCKTDCPACARMCPAQAIIFPKHSEPEINGEAYKSSVYRESDIFGKDLYSRLAERRKNARKNRLIKDK